MCDTFVKSRLQTTDVHVLIPGGNNVGFTPHGMSNGNLDIVSQKKIILLRFTELQQSAFRFGKYIYIYLYIVL